MSFPHSTLHSRALSVVCGCRGEGPITTRESLICGRKEAYLWGRARPFRSILAYISNSNKPPLGRRLFDRAGATGLWPLAFIMLVLWAALYWAIIPQRGLRFAPPQTPKSAPDSPAVLAHNTRRSEHPLLGRLALSGRGYAVSYVRTWTRVGEWYIKQPRA